MFDLSIYIDKKRNEVDTALNQIFSGLEPRGRIRSAMRYSLMAGGKRLRPILCLASAEAVGGTGRNALSIGCALEMIHTYSLIHDDLPAMDNDVLRRGKATCHVEFDEATAILAGDALLTLAFQTLSSPERPMPIEPETQLDILHAISGAAGFSGMIEGQMQDIATEGLPLTLDELESIHTLKTGALIEAAIYSGAVSENATPDQLRRLKTYGRSIGLAFQVKDDILNVEGDPTVMGKAAGTDEIRGKTTYPSVMGLEPARAFARELVINALQALDNFDNRSDPLRAIANYIINRTR